MAEQPRPLSKEQAPEPANSYERADPKRESGAGRLTNNTNATPTPSADKISESVTNAQDGSKQLNAQEAATTSVDPDRTAADNESLGWEKKPKA